MPDADGQASLFSFRRERIEVEHKAHGHKTARSLKEQKEYLISAISAWGPSDSEPAEALSLHRVATFKIARIIVSSRLRMFLLALDTTILYQKLQATSHNL